MNLNVCSQENPEKLLPPELHSLTPVCTKSFVGWGFARDPTGELTAPLDPLAGFKGPISKRTGGEGKDGRGKRERRGRREFVFP